MSEGSTPAYDPVAALESDLAAVGRRHGTATEQLLRDLLGALVWGEGEGVPGPLVPVLAQAVTGRAYSDDDVATLLTRASGHLGETEVDGRPVYRLADKRLRHYLRTAALARGVEMGNGPSSADVSAAVHARITEALLGAWRHAPAAAEPYLERVLPRHAALAGRVEWLCWQAGYLEAADPDGLLAVLPSWGSAVAGAYRRAAQWLRGRRPDERALALDIATAAGGGERRTFPGGVRLRWRRGPLAMDWQDFVGHQGRVRTAAMATVDDIPVIVSGGSDDTVRLWDIRSGEARGQPLQHASMTVTTGIVDGGPLVISGGSDGTVCWWDARTGTRRGGPRPHFGPFWGMAPSKFVNALATGVIDGRHVIISGGELEWGSWSSWYVGTVCIWDARNGKRRGKRLRHGDGLHAVAVGIIDDAPVVVSAGPPRWARSSSVWADLRELWRWLVARLRGEAAGEKQGDVVRLWDARTGKARGKPLPHGGHVDWVAIWVLDDRPTIVSCGEGTVRFWNARSGQLEAHLSPGHVMRCPPTFVDGMLLVLSGGEAGLRLCDARTGRAVGPPLKADTTRPMAVGVVDDQLVVVDERPGGGLRRWHVSMSRALGPSLPGDDGEVTAVAMTVIDHRPVVISGGRDGTLRRWDAASGEAYGEPLHHGEAVIDVVAGVVDDEPVIVSLGSDERIRLWDTRTGQARGQPLYHPAVQCLTMGMVDDQPVIVSGGLHDVMRQWDARSGQLRRLPFQEYAGDVSALAFGVIDAAPVMVSGHSNGVLRLWDARTGARGQSLDGHHGGVNALALGVVGHEPVIVSAGDDGIVRWWGARTGELRGELADHDGPVQTVAMGTLDDEPVVASGGCDGTVRLWQPRTGATTVLPVLSPVTSIAIAHGAVVVGTTSSLLVVDVPGLASPRGLRAG